MFVDTNVILRALLNDHPEHSPRAQKFFKTSARKNTKLETSDAVIAEVFYVLESSLIVPKLSRGAIADLVVSFIQLVDLTFSSRHVFSRALTLYREHGHDLPDILLTASAEESDTKVASFDKGIDKLNPKIRLQP
jgi:predicted nucleic acid-binding protein